MPTKAGGYYAQTLPHKGRVPSVTQVVNARKECGGLVHAAWKLGMDGINYRDVWGKAADAGSCAHALVEAHIKGKEFQNNGWSDEVIEQGRSAFRMFLEWSLQTSLEVVATETALVSEDYGFGGTFDAVLVNDRRSLADWKSSDALYSDYLIQLAGYEILWNENHPDEPINGGAHLIRFSKKHADFEHRWFQDLTDARFLFLHLLEAYRLDQGLKARMR